MGPDNTNSPKPPNGAAPAPNQTGDPSVAISIPDHELIRPIGKGSYGTVWLAKHSLGFYRAIKIVYRQAFDSNRPFDRELKGLKNFEPISRSHEGFVDVLHVGTVGEDCFYYVMELGDDQKTGQTIDPATYAPKTLNKEISFHGKLPFQSCLELGIALSDALGTMHKLELVHRDIKPANIIFVNGVPKLADIGLVAGLDEANSYVGTQGYIPPEGAGKPQADIYSLGKVLYEASTGKDRQDFPDLPTQLESFADQEGFLELNEVMVQACRNDLTKRYQTAWEMHSDLLVIAKGKSVKRLRVLEKRLSNFKRTGAICLIAVILALAIGIPIFQARKASSAARAVQVGENLAYGNDAVYAGDMLGALPYYTDALRLDNADKDKKSAHRLQVSSVLNQCPRIVQMWKLPSQIDDGEFSPDGKMVVLCPHNNEAKIFNVDSGEEYLPSLTTQAGIPTKGSFSPDGKWLIFRSEGSNASLWNISSLTHISFPQSQIINSAKFDSSGRRFVTGGNDGVARVWDSQAGTNQTPLLLRGHKLAIWNACFSHNNKLIATASKDTNAILWDATTGKQIRTFSGHTSWLYGVSFSPDDKKIVTTSFDRTARIWDVATGQRILFDMKHLDGVVTAEFSPDGRLILTGSWDGTARIFGADSGQPYQANLLLRHRTAVTHATFNHEGTRVLTACADGTAYLWDLTGCVVPYTSIEAVFSEEGNRYITVSNGFTKVIDSLSGKEISSSPEAEGIKLKNEIPDPSGQKILSMLRKATNTEFRVTDATTGKSVAPPLIIPGRFSLNNCALSRDGGKLATFFLQTNAQIWNVFSGQPLSKPLPHAAFIKNVFFNPDGNLFGIIAGKRVEVRNTTNGEPAFKSLAHDQIVTCATFSPDGRFLATSCADSQINKLYAQVWDARTGEPVGPRLWHGDGVLFVAFSKVGGRIATAGEDHNAMVWDMKTGRQLIQPLKHAEKVLTVCFSPDGKWVVTACNDQTVRVWSAETGEPLTPPLRHLGHLRKAWFLPDGKRIAASGGETTVAIWDLPLDTQPVEDLMKLATLLSGGLVTPSTAADPSPAAPPEILWQQLRDVCPEMLKTTADKNDAWHEFEAEENEAENQWFAASNHLAHLIFDHPNDPLLVKRFDAARSHLAEVVGK